MRLNYIEKYRRSVANPPKLSPQNCGKRAIYMLRRIVELGYSTNIELQTKDLLQQIDNSQLTVDKKPTN